MRARIAKILRSRRGMTLMELMTTLALLTVLIGIIITMLFTGMNTYAGQADFGLNKRIGDACLEFIERRLYDASSIRIADSFADTSAGTSADTSASEAIYTSLDGRTTAPEGRLYWVSAEYGAADVFGEEFYHGRRVSFWVHDGGEGLVKILVTVYGIEGEGFSPAYENASTLRLLNLNEITGGAGAALRVGYPE